MPAGNTSPTAFGWRSGSVGQGVPQASAQMSPARRPHILIDGVKVLPLQEDVCRKPGDHRATATKRRLALRQADDGTWWKGSRTGDHFVWTPAKGDAADLLAAQETPEAKAAAKTAVVATTWPLAPQAEATPVKLEFRAYQKDNDRPASVCC